MPLPLIGVIAHAILRAYRKEWAEFFRTYANTPNDVPPDRLFSLSLTDIPVCKYRLGDHTFIHNYR
eukprot:1620611-Pleurochrysis_carterae.AAC.1